MLFRSVRTAVGPFTLARSIPLDAITPETAREALLPCAAAVSHLGSVTLAGEQLALAIRGGLIDVGSPAPALAAVDADGALVGILKRHESGSHRLRPNFHGAG